MQPYLRLSDRGGSTRDKDHRTSVNDESIGDNDGSTGINDEVIP